MGLHHPAQWQKQIPPRATSRLREKRPAALWGMRLLTGGAIGIKQKITPIRRDALAEETAGRLIRTANHQLYREEKIQ